MSFELPVCAFLPVVHVEHENQARKNARVALENGAHGFFLITHGVIDDRELHRIYKVLRKEFPNEWIGVNFLSLVPEQIFSILPKDVSGLWVDDAGLRFPEQHARLVMGRRQEMRADWKGQYFGGVAFKYQPELPELGRPADRAKLAAPFVDVITTSGSGTGSAPGVDKIRLMKEAVPDKPLAIASGMTPENIRTFLPYADYFLVATGISDSHTELNSTRVRAFADIVRSHTP